MKLKRNDKVLIIKGKNRGKTGKILRMLKEENKVVIENINLMKKAVRPGRKRQKGGIVEFPAPLSRSNVQLICPNCGKKTRVGFRIKENKSRKSGKVRICCKCKEIIS
jgi:large subunit ribosomal protein L24